MQQVFNILEKYGRFGIVGSRMCPAAAAACAAALPMLPAGACVSTGCAAGVDAVVRASCAAATVFKVEKFQAATYAARLMLRTTALVQYVGNTGGLLFAFPSTSCPASVSPSSPFPGAGAGTWGAIALAVSKGFPVLVWAKPGVEFPGWLVGEWCAFECFYSPEKKRQPLLF